jgi:hypothetical protein
MGKRVQVHILVRWGLERVAYVRHVNDNGISHVRRGTVLAIPSVTY